MVSCGLLVSCTSSVSTGTEESQLYVGGVYEVATQQVRTLNCNYHGGETEAHTWRVAHSSNSLTFLVTLEIRSPPYMTLPGDVGDDGTFLVVNEGRPLAAPFTLEGRFLPDGLEVTYTLDGSLCLYQAQWEGRKISGGLNTFRSSVSRVVGQRVVESRDYAALRTR